MNPLKEIWKHRMGIAVLLVTFSFFFGVIGFINETSDNTTARTYVTISHWDCAGDEYQVSAGDPGYGNNGNFYAGQGFTYEAMLRFDLLSMGIPVGADISSITFYVYAVDSQTGTQTIWPLSMSNSGTQLKGIGDAYSGHGHSTLDVTSIGSFAASGTGWKNSALTPLTVLQQQFDTYGLIAFAFSGADAYQTFYSREYSSGTNAPYISITYSPDPDVTELKIYPAADARVQSSNPTTNFGSATTSYVGCYPSTPDYSWDYFRFDLSSIPDGSTITYAMFSLWKNYENREGWNAVQLNASQATDWVEGSITWNTKPTVTATVLTDFDYGMWTGGGPYDIYVNSTSASFLSNVQSQWTSYDKAYYCVASNRSMSQTYGSTGYDMKEQTGTNKDPVLVIYYETPTGWAPTITSTPPSPTHAIPNGTTQDNPASHIVTGGGNYTPTADTYIDSAFPTTNYGTQTLFWDCKWNSYGSPPWYQTQFYLMRWNLTTLGVPANATITGAWLWLYQTQSRGHTNYLALPNDVSSAPDDWAEASVTWNTYTDGYLYSSGQPSFADATGWHNMTVTDMVQIEFSTYGYGKLHVIGFTDGTSSSVANKFYSKEYGTASYRPGLHIHWAYNYFHNGTASPAYTIRPSSDVTYNSYAQGSPTVKPNMHENLQSNDGDSSYIYTTSMYSQALTQFGMEDISPTGANYTISTVTAFFSIGQGGYYADAHLNLFNGSTEIWHDTLGHGVNSGTYYTYSWTFDFYPGTARLWTETDIDNLQTNVTVYRGGYGGPRCTEVGIIIQANETDVTQLYRYVYMTGDYISYTLTANETVTWDATGGVPSWATFSVGNSTLWGHCTAGNETSYIRAHSTAGDLYAYQNYTWEVWGLAGGYWAPTLLTSAGTSATKFEMYVYSPLWNESVTMTVYTNASLWLNINYSNQTLWGIPTATASYYVNIEAESVAGGLILWENYTLTVGFTPWGPSIQNTATLTVENGTLWSFTVVWNETIVAYSTAQANNATGESWSPTSQGGTMQWTAPAGNGTVWFNFTATSYDGEAEGYYNFTVTYYYYIPPVIPPSGYHWIGNVGIQLMFGGFGFVGMIALPALYIKYRNTGESKMKSLFFFIFLEMTMIGLFYASLVW